MKSQFLNVLKCTLINGKSNEHPNDLTSFEKKIIFYLLNKNTKGKAEIISPNNSTLCAAPKQL